LFAPCNLPPTLAIWAGVVDIVALEGRSADGPLANPVRSGRKQP
jgi:hypothetical protein